MKFLFLFLIVSPQILLGQQNADERSSREHYVQGVSWLKQGEHGKAIEAFTEAIQFDPNYGYAFGGRGFSRLSEGEYDKAILDFNEAIRLDSGQKWQDLSYRGYCWLKKGNHDKAIKDFDEAVKLNPLVPEIFINRGTSLISIGEYDKAVDDLTEGIRLQPKSDLITARAYFNRCLAQSSKGQYSFAIKDCTDAVRLDPADARAHNLLAKIHGTCRNPEFRNGEKAIEHGLKACELTNWTEDGYIRNLAAAHAETGDFGEAIKLLNMAIKLDPNKNRVLNLRILNLFKQGEPYRR